MCKTVSAYELTSIGLSVANDCANSSGVRSCRSMPFICISLSPLLEK